MSVEQREIFRRDGITNSNPVGTTWTRILHYICKCKHVSYDLGLLWIIYSEGKIMKCQGSYSSSPVGVLANTLSLVWP
ncbi:hypothetical protein Y1Q_0004779 [Alligator mississippiensis]|uniref:Uncharacterized protein n=1 Tax=Alligator mississippiensis TaxID=8496 RepID=A0A151M4B3_ALLMI|nr:hypothetical protein Y1Q_0004779 [Alligator mississippiensis]